MAWIVDLDINNGLISVAQKENDNIIEKFGPFRQGKITYQYMFSLYMNGKENVDDEYKFLGFFGRIDMAPKEKQFDYCDKEFKRLFNSLPMPKRENLYMSFYHMLYEITSVLTFDKKQDETYKEDIGMSVREFYKDSLIFKDRESIINAYTSIEYEGQEQEILEYSRLTPREFKCYFEYSDKGVKQYYVVENIEDLIAFDVMMYYCNPNAKGQIGVCRFCNKPFYSSKKGALYCSDLCGVYYHQHINDITPLQNRYNQVRTESTSKFFAIKKDKKKQRDVPNNEEKKIYKQIRKDWRKEALEIKDNIESGSKVMDEKEYSKLIRKRLKELCEEHGMELIRQA